MQKMKSVSLKKQCVGQKRFAVIFVEAGNILNWFNQAIEIFLAVFHLNTKVKRYCDAKMNVISDVLRDREGRFSITPPISNAST